MLSNKWYDILKWVTLILIPALSSLYFGLSQTLDLPYGKEVVGTLALTATFMGSLLGISNAKYNRASE